MKGFGFDKASAEKIAKVVRGALGAAGGVKSHRRADVSGPGNHLAIAQLTDVAGNTHKFKFVVASYEEDVGDQVTDFQEVEDEYYAHDLCGDPLLVGDHVWVVDHNNQWFIVEKCGGIGSTEGTDAGGCCGGCSNGTITGCADSTKDCHNAYQFEIPERAGEIEGQVDCCGDIQGIQILYHDTDCTWKGRDLGGCDDVDGAPPHWSFVLTGEEPWDNSLTLSLADDPSGTPVHIEYRNPYPYCCNCENKFVLVCPDQLPAGCEAFPCELCLVPGPKCCAETKMTVSLTATISVPLGSQCGCADGQTLHLAYRPTTQDWLGVGVFCDEYIELTLSCEVDGGRAADFRLDVRWPGACGPDQTYSPDSTTSTCLPLYLPFESIDVSGCCGVTSSGQDVNIVITI